MNGDSLEHRRIESQIGDHMVNELATFMLEEPIYQVSETQNLIPVTVREDGATVVRTYIAEYGIEVSDVPRITVAPITFRQAWVTRQHFQEQFLIDITVHQRLVGPPDVRGQTKEQQQAAWAANVTKHGDHVTKLAQDVRMHFEKCPMRWAKIEECLGCTGARWMGVQANSIYEEGIADNKQIVLCVMRHLWMTVREVCECHAS